MAASSSQRKERAPSFGRLAFQYANAAEFGLALELLEGDERPEAFLLEAKIALRMSNPTRAVKALNRLRKAMPSQEQMATVLRSVANARLSGDSYKEVVVPGVASEATRLLALYYRGMHQVKHDLWEDAKRSALPVASSDDPGIRCLGLLLQAYNESHDQRYDVALSRFEAAYAALSADSENDEVIRTAIVFGVASLALETMEISMFRRALDILSSLAPTKWTAKAAADAFSCGSQICELLGDPGNALDLLLRARSVVPRASLSLASVEIDLAALIERLNSPQVAALHRANAKQILFAADWGDANIDDRIVLLDYIVEAHAHDHPGASRALTLALSREGKRDNSFFLEHDCRAAILADFAKGLLLAHRDLTRAVDIILACQERWLEIGYKRRAAEAGRTLLRFGRSEGEDALESILKRVPKSSLRMEVESIRAHPTSLLFEAELRVAKYICEGLTSRQIAEKLDRSHHTIRNQTTSIYRRLGVSSRSALVSLMKDAGEL